MFLIQEIGYLYNKNSLFIGWLFETPELAKMMQISMQNERLGFKLKHLTVSSFTYEKLKILDKHHLFLAKIVLIFSLNISVI